MTPKAMPTPSPCHSLCPACNQPTKPGSGGKRVCNMHGIVESCCDGDQAMEWTQPAPTATVVAQCAAHTPASLTTK